MNGAALIAGIGLLTVAGLAWWRTEHVTHPVTVFCSVWGGALCWIWLTGQRYYPLSGSTILVFVVGAVGFVWGCWLVHVSRSRVVGARLPSDQQRVVSTRLLNFVTLVLLAGFPVYLSVLRGIVRGSGIGFFYAARVAAVQGTVAAQMPPVIANLVPLAMIAALVAAAQPETTLWGRGRALLLLALALAFAITTAGRGAPLALVLAWMVIGLVRTRRIRVPVLLGGLALAVGVFGGLGVLVRKGDADPESPMRENALAIAANLESYSLGGVLAFDQTVRNPGANTHIGDIERVGMLLANFFGASYTIPSRHAEYTAIGERNITNVHTMYYTYFRAGGYLGAMLLLIPIGVFATLAFTSARDGAVAGRVWHGVISASVLQGIFNEPFFSNFTFLVKLGLFLVVVHIMGHLSVVESRNPVGAAESA